MIQPELSTAAEHCSVAFLTDGLPAFCLNAFRSETLTTYQNSPFPFGSGPTDRFLFPPENDLESVLYNPRK